MRQVLMRNCLVATAVGLLIGAPAILVGVQAPAGTTVFEGARLIVGDGQRADRERRVRRRRRAASRQVGRAADVKVPAGAARVDLTGKTVMPAIIDTHTHLSHDARGAHRRPAAPRLLRRRRGDEPRPGRRRRCRSRCARETHSGRRALPHRGPRHHDAGAGPHRRAVLDHQRGRRPARPCRSSPRRRSTSSRSGSTTATASTRS